MLDRAVKVAPVADVFGEGFVFLDLAADVGDFFLVLLASIVEMVYIEIGKATLELFGREDRLGSHEGL